MSGVCDYVGWNCLVLFETIYLLKITIYEKLPYNKDVSQNPIKWVYVKSDPIKTQANEIWLFVMKIM